MTNTNKIEATLKAIKKFGGAYFNTSIGNDEYIHNDDRTMFFKPSINLEYVKFLDVIYEDGFFKAIIKNPITDKYDVWMVSKSPLGFVYEDILASDVT